MQQFIAYVVAHPYEILGAVNALIAGVIAVSLLVPGEQPEKALQGIADFLAKFSRK